MAGAYTGGIAFGLAGGGAAGTGGFLAGYFAGMTEGVASTAILSEGNHELLGDDRLPWQAYAIAGGTGGMIGGTVNGVKAILHGKKFLDGGLTKRSLV